MNIALIGYGKMGKAIEEIAIQKGHAIVLKISSANKNVMTADNLKKADMAIEFTGPSSAFNNIKSCIDAGLPVISGSTGWLHKAEEVNRYCLEKKGAFLYASNFSMGVNIFFELNKKLAELMSVQNSYDVSIEETHHTQKKDKPSGTAITLAEQIIERNSMKQKWTLDKGEASDLTINCKREDPAPGTHIVKYQSAIDDIEIVHTAHSRKGFAYGAVQAAEFIFNKKGIYTMKDVLGI